jgi:hypothetical protein
MTTPVKPPIKTVRRDYLLATASKAIAGGIADINVRRDGSLALLNAGKEMLWTGFSPEAEVLKGLIVQVDANGRAIRLVAGCLPKFYNHTESADNDKAFFAAMARPGSRMVFTLKEDGSNLRPYWHPDRGRVEFATRGMLQVQSGTGGYLDFSGVAAAIAKVKYPALLDPKLVARYTVICELIHPDNQIVTHYGKREDLPVIAVIDLASGDELRRAELVTFCRAHRLSVVPALAPKSADFGQAIAELRRAWADTDLEGAVISIENPTTFVPFRLKVKSLRYLALMRLKNACTLRRTRELCEANGLHSWLALRAHLISQFPELPEEVQMGYRAHFARWFAWDTMVRNAIKAAIATYNALPVRNADQKTFALFVANRPDRSELFLLRSIYSTPRKAADPQAASKGLDVMFRRRFEERLKEPAGSTPDPSLVG